MFFLLTEPYGIGFFLIIIRSKSADANSIKETTILYSVLYGWTTEVKNKQSVISLAGILCKSFKNRFPIVVKKITMRVISPKALFPPKAYLKWKAKATQRSRQRHVSKIGFTMNVKHALPRRWKCS